MTREKRQWFETWFEVIDEAYAKTGNERVTAVAWEVMARKLLDES